MNPPRAYTPAGPYYVGFLLHTKPAMTVASESLTDDEDFVRFVVSIMSNHRNKEGFVGGVSLSEPLAWFLFEEVGWPEGRGYCYDAFVGPSSEATIAHFLAMLRRAEPKIHERLESRRLHWKKPNKIEFIKAHARLLELLEGFKPQTKPLK